MPSASPARPAWWPGASRGRFVLIRGIGERSQFVEPLNPSIGLIIDGIDFSGLGNAGTLFDVEQVEVLRRLLAIAAQPGEAHQRDRLTALHTLAEFVQIDEMLVQVAAEASGERILGYEQRVAETVRAIRERYPEAAENAGAWPRIKIAFIGKLMDHWQAECAETFYNSVACRVLHRDYYKSEYIFWRPAISTEFLEGSRPVYRSHYPENDGLRRSLLEVLTSFELAVPFRDLRGDLRCLERAVLEQRNRGWRAQPPRRGADPPRLPHGPSWTEAPSARPPPPRRGPAPGPRP